VEDFSDGVWCIGAVVAVTFGILESLELFGVMLRDGSDSFQKAVEKLI
jgi:hypothetical protein